MASLECCCQLLSVWLDVGERIHGYPRVQEALAIPDRTAHAKRGSLVLGGWGHEDAGPEHAAALGGGTQKRPHGSRNRSYDPSWSSGGKGWIGHAAHLGARARTSDHA